MKNISLKYIAVLLFVLAISFISSCRKDFDTVPSFGNLEFSKDTVFLDTVFTNIGSATYNLKVYNRSNNNITIPKISLQNGNSSNYRLNVDGIAGKEFNQIDLLAKDSMYVFIETTINASNVANPLYTDKILFDTGTNQQNVDLVTLVQDANFIFPERNTVSMEVANLTLNGEPTTIKGRFLKDNELTFTKAKPTVIYGYAAIPELKTLTIEAGAQVYFHDNSGIIVDNKASLKVNGTLDQKVVFQGDRLEHSFSNIAGQWGTILVLPGSINNTISHAIVKNATIGIWMGNLTGSENETNVTIQNSEIYNSSAYGIWARDSKITANNLVIGNAGLSSLSLTLGGSYNFTHCTFANFWNNGLRQLPAVLVNNYQDTTDSNNQNMRLVNNLSAANFINCIFDGSNNFELFFDKVEGSAFNYNVSNCLIKYNPSSTDLQTNSEMDFTNTNFYQDNIINSITDFKDPQKEDFIIGEKSDAINKAKSSIFTIDILGIDRTTSPDIGAYQHVTIN